MADSLTMAHLAFGKRSRLGSVAANIGRGLIHRGGRAKAIRRHPRKHRFKHGKMPRVHHRKGIVLNDEFVKTMLLVQLIKGATRT